MRVTTNVCGAIAASMILLGCVFEILHFPGAGPLIVFGTSLLIIPFLILWLIVRLKETPTTLGKALAITGFFVLTTLFTGLMFKVQHWPGAGPQLGAAVVLAILVYLPMFLIGYKAEKVRPHNILYSLIIGASAVALGVAMRPPSNMLNSYVPVDNRLRSIVKSAGAGNEILYAEMEELIAANRGAVQPYYEKAIQLKKMTSDLDRYISGIRGELISQTERIPRDIADTLPLSYVYMKENYDIPSYVMIGDDPAVPREGEYSAADLRKKIFSYRDAALQLVDEDRRAIMDTKLGLHINNVYSNGYMETWETGNFFHMPLVAVATNLAGMRIEVRNAECAILSELCREAHRAMMGNIVHADDTAGKQNP